MRRIQRQPLVRICTIGAIAYIVCAGASVHSLFFKLTSASHASNGMLSPLYKHQNISQLLTSCYGFLFNKQMSLKINIEH